MKKVISSSWANALVALALTSALFAFKSPVGEHTVQIYLDSKLMIDQHVNFKGSAPKLALDPSEKYSKLIVRYNECGRTVSGRKITVKNRDNEVLKDWRFEGSSRGLEGSMECSLKEILALKQKGSNTLKLYYSSNDFPEGQQIAQLVIGDNVTTASK